MKAEIETRIDSYVRENLSPKKDERDLITERYAVLSEMLEGTVFQSGSYPRYTSITPVNDLDVIWELPQSLLERVTGTRVLFKAISPNDLEISRILQDLASSLAEECRKAGVNVRVRAQSHSVGVYFGQSDDEFSMDIVPAIPNGDLNEFGETIYLVPDIVLIRKAARADKYARHQQINWLKSDPRGYKTAAAQVNEKTDAYRKAAKVIKSWKRGCRGRNDVFPLKSFHLEVIVQGITARDTSLGTVAALQQAYQVLPACVDGPKYRDRADNSRFIDEYIRDMDATTKRLVLSEINQAASIMSQIADETDPDKAEQALRRLIGHSLPSPVVPAWSAPAVSRPYHEDHQR